MPFTPEPIISRPIWDMLGLRMPRGVLGLSDPDVHLIEGRRVMFIGGLSTSFRNRLYRACLPAGTEPEQAGWVLDRQPIIADPPKGAWDAGGMHTPSYVPLHNGRPERIYYAGRATTRRYGEGSAYAIGVLSLDDRGGWVRREAPVLRGWPVAPTCTAPPHTPNRACGSRAATPSPNRADWSAPVRLLDTDAPGIPSWMGRGVCGPSVVPLPGGRRAVFFTGTHHAGSWSKAARFRLAHARRLPVPSPYFLATGAIDIALRRS